jgi:hypothetical protein
MLRRLFENLVKPCQPHLPQTNVSGCFHEFEKHYKHSHTDAIAFLSKLQHNSLYEVLDLVNSQWIKQNYTYLVDNNEQETTEKMIHGYRMGWLRPYGNNQNK